MSGHCDCDSGWEGEACDVKSCDPRCHQHGDCVDGSCVCMQGWGGRHCTLDECPDACSGHGICSNISATLTWSCHCSAGWSGADCSIQLEMVCDDKLDNDNGIIQLL